MSKMYTLVSILLKGNRLIEEVSLMSYDIFSAT
jgi:hypothetical protein